jgi:hypothetical protein
MRRKTPFCRDTPGPAFHGRGKSADAGVSQRPGGGKGIFALEARRLNAGISTIPDFLDAQSRLVRARGNYAQAILDFSLAESELKLMTGKTPVDLSVLE